MKTFLKRNLALLLVVCMIVSACPATVFAADEETSAEAVIETVTDAVAADESSAEPATQTEVSDTEAAETEETPAVPEESVPAEDTSDVEDSELEETPVVPEETAPEEDTSEDAAVEETPVVPEEETLEEPGTEDVPAEEAPTEETPAEEESAEAEAEEAEAVEEETEEEDSLAAATSGTCGTSLTWALSDGTLTISGTGTMTSYSSGKQPWYASMSSITAVVVEEGVTCIGNYAFYNATSLASVSLPSTLTSIKSCAFMGCSALTSITIPDAVTTIGLQAFQGSGLTKVTIPGAVTSLSSYAFTECTSLKTVTFSTGTTSIGAEAFKGCTSLSSVTLPSGMTRISAGAFEGCTALKSITLPDTITYLGNYAFSGCTALTSIALPNNLTTLPHVYDDVYTDSYYCTVFADCTSLTSVEIGSNLQTLYTGTFADSTKLTTYTFNGLNTTIESESAGYYYNESTKKYVKLSGVAISGYEDSTAETYAAANGFTFNSLGPLTANGSCGTNVTWSISGSTLTISGTGAMTNYSDETETPWYNLRGNIRNIVIESGVTTIGMYAFCRFGALSSVTIPSTVTTVYRYAFAYCSSLTSVDLSSVTYLVGAYAFYDCQALSNVTWPSTMSYLYESSFAGCTSLKSVALPAVKTIRASAFQECTALQTAVVSSGTTTINSMAFGVTSTVYDSNGNSISCGSLADVVLPDSVTSIADDAFYGNTDAVVHFCGSGSTAYSYAVSKGMATSQHYWISGSSGTTTCYACGESGIAVSPTTKSVLVGSNATFSVTPPDSYTKPTYQWQYRTSATGEWKTSTATGNKTAVVTIPGTISRNGYQYRCMVTDASGNVTCSNAATLYVTGIKTQPTDKNVVAGNNAKFTVTATGTGLSYQWQYRTSSTGTWYTATATGNKTAAMTVPGTTGRDGYQYRCKVTDGAGNVVYSNAATLRVTGIKMPPANAHVLVGGTATFTVVATGADLSYQWQYRTSSTGTWYSATATGNKTATLQVPGTISRNGYEYRCKVTDGKGNVVYSSAATLYILSITTHPADANIVSSGSAIFTVEAIGDGLSYQWQYRTSSAGNWYSTSADGSNTATVTIPGATYRDNYQYRCKVTDAGGNVVYSDAATLRVTGIKSSPASTTVVVGTKASFTVSASGADLTYQWQYRTSSSGTWTETYATGYKTTTLTVPGTASRDNYQYRCKVTDGKGRSVYSYGATLRVTSITTQPADVNIIRNNTAYFTVGTTGDIKSYQWQYQTSNGTNWYNTTLSGYNTATLEVPGTTGRDAYKYRCIITDTAGNKLTSDAATLRVTGIKSSPSDATVVVGTKANFTVSASGANLTYQWQYRTSSSGTWTETYATGYKTTTLTIPGTASRDNYQYCCKVTDGEGNTVYTYAATLHVTSIAAQPTDMSVAVGTNAAFTVGTTGADLTYQWQYKTATGTKWYNTTLTGCNTATLTVPGTISRNGYQYHCIITDTAGNQLTSDAATLHVTGVKTQPADISVVEGETAEFSIVATGESLSYQWQYRASAEDDWAAVEASDGKTAAVSIAAAVEMDGYEFRCQVTDGAGNVVYSDAAVLTVIDANTYLAMLLEDEISTYSGTWGLYYENVTTGDVINLGTEPMVAASLIKLYVAGAYCEAVENGEVTDDYRSQLAVMLSESSNSACNTIIDVLGMDRINQFISDFGAEDTVLNRKMLATGTENYTSPEDCSKVLKALLDGTFVNQSVSDELLGYLKAQVRTTKIPAGVPSGVETANKTGELTGVENDAAVIWSDAGTYILCIMSGDITSSTAQSNIVDLSERIYAYLNS